MASLSAQGEQHRRLAEAHSGYKESGRFQIADQGLAKLGAPCRFGGRFYIRNRERSRVTTFKAR